nr:holo-ACP synthase [Paenibacillus elgii]
MFARRGGEAVIYGVGIDLQSVPQMGEAIGRQGERFLRKIFTPGEIAYCSKHRGAARHYAVRWAAKEAFYKAVGDVLPRKYGFLDVEVRNLPSGRPVLELHGSTGEAAAHYGLSFRISLSHSGDYALAQVIAIQEAGKAFPGIEPMREHAAGEAIRLC